MRRIRALWIGVIAYFASMFLGLVVNSLLGVSMDTPSSMLPEIWLISLAVLVIVAVGSSWRYFSGKHTHPDVWHGFYLGLLIVLVGFFFDLLTVGLFYLSGDLPAHYNIWDMYSQVWFRVAAGLMIAITTIVARHKSK